MVLPPTGGALAEFPGAGDPRNKRRPLKPVTIVYRDVPDGLSERHGRQGAGPALAGAWYRGRSAQLVHPL